MRSFGAEIGMGVWSVLSYSVLFWVGMFSDNYLKGKLKEMFGPWQTIVSVAGACTISTWFWCWLLLGNSSESLLRWLALAYIAEMFAYFLLLTSAYIKNFGYLYGDWAAEGIIEIPLWPIAALWEAADKRSEWRGKVSLLLASLGALVAFLMVGRVVCSTLNVYLPAFLLNNHNWLRLVGVYVVCWLVVGFLLREPDESLDDC